MLLCRCLRHGGGVFSRFVLTGVACFLISVCAGLCQELPADDSAPTARTNDFLPLIATNTPATDESTKPPVKHTTKTNRLAALQLSPGFRIDIVAEAPLVTAPVTMTFDANGRLYIAEIPGFYDQPSSGQGRIRLLEDADGDGFFDTSAVFADELSFPAGIACFEDGIFVASTPEIIYLKDTQRQGVADLRRTAFIGFGGTSTLAQNTLLTDLKWGPDSRIHGVTAGLGGDITSPLAPYLPAVSLAGADFSFDPKTMALRRETGPANSALSFDAVGRKFVTDRTRPLRQPMYEERFYLRNPLFSPAPALWEVLPPALPLFPLTATSQAHSAASASPPTNRLSAPASVSSSNARGTVIYRSGLFPSNYFGNVFFANPQARVVHRAVLTRSGLTWTASRARREETSEFLRSTDPLFQPTQIAEGPDGALYISDFRGGGEQGRIYRVTPVEGFTPAKYPQMASMGIVELIASLGHRDGWHRETALRLLFEREDRTNAPALLARALTASPSPLIRVQALHALAGLGSLTDKVLILALRDKDEVVRETAARLIEPIAQSGRLTDALWNQIKTVAQDESAPVRYQLAFALGYVQRPGAFQVAVAIARRDLVNPWTQTALLSSQTSGAADLLLGMAQDTRLLSEPAGREFVRKTGLIVGLQARPAGVSRIISFLTGNNNPAPLQAFSVLGPVAEGIEHTGNYLAQFDSERRLIPWFASALRTASAPGITDALRLQAARTLAATPQPYPETADLLFLLLANPNLSRPVRNHVLEALGRYDDPRLTTNVLARWSVFSPSLKPDLVTMLLSRTERVPIILDFVQNGVIAPPALSPTHKDLLRFFPEPKVSQRGVNLLGPGSTHRLAAQQKYQPALKLPGKAARGREVFLNRCASCHRVDRSGAELGPPLDDLKSVSRESVLSAILEPNLQLKPGYETWLLQTKAGQLSWGILKRQDPETLILARPDREDSIWLRSWIQFQETQPWSFMPEGLETGLTLEAMADLLHFLSGPPP